MAIAITNIIPLFIIMIVGLIAGKFNLINDNVIDGIKNIIIRLALPGVLFLSFSRADLDLSSLYIVLAMFILCLALYGTGSLMHKIFPKLFSLHYTNAFFTAFEFGMIGVPLFSLIWGMEKLPVFALVGFGHELFVWFVYIPLLESRQTGIVDWKKIIYGIIRSPVAWGILSGVLFNLTGWISILEKSLAGAVILNTISMIGGVIAPLILLVIGFTLRSSRFPGKKTLVLIGGRLFFIILFLVPALFLLGKLLPDQDIFYFHAIIAFVLLPPSYILPLLIPESLSHEKKISSEGLVLYTFLFLGLFSLFTLLISEISS